MNQIYIAAYKEFNDYKKLERILDYLLSRLDKKDVIFYVSNGEPGDNTCFKYVVEHGYKYIDWCPDKHGNRAKQKLPYIKNSTHSILITNGESRGISIAARYSWMFVKNKIVVIKPIENSICVWKDKKLLVDKKINEL